MNLIRLAAALFALSIGPVRAIAAAPGEKTLLFFGDSLTYGLGLEDPSTQSYPALIQARIRAEHLPWTVVNAGLSGDTTADGLGRLYWVLRRRPDLFVLALGANDGLRGIDPAVTASNLEAIVDRVRGRYPDCTIVLAGMKMAPILGQDYVRAYDAVFPAVAAKKHLILIPFLLEGVGGNPQLNQADGMHPTAQGAAVVARVVWKTLAPLLEAVKSPR